MRECHIESTVLQLSVVDRGSFTRKVLWARRQLQVRLCFAFSRASIHTSHLPVSIMLVSCKQLHMCLIVSIDRASSRESATQARASSRGLVVQCSRLAAEGLPPKHTYEWNLPCRRTSER